jgi:hypothetical protein
MKDMKLNLNDIALIGRTFDEYRGMFKLDDIDKAEKILDVGSGVSSFCSQANELGYNVTACDSIYCLPPETLKNKAENDLNEIIRQLPQLKEMYIWDYFGDIPALKNQRESAYKDFSNDYSRRLNDRYKYDTLPKSSFHNNEFSITLSSHFLFLYDDRLNYDFHKKAIFEMLRISSKEVRIFPLVNLKGQRSEYVKSIIYEAFDKGYGISIEKTDYEFIKNGNEMLIISKN